MVRQARLTKLIKALMGPRERASTFLVHAILLTRLGFLDIGFNNCEYRQIVTVQGRGNVGSDYSGI